MQKIILVSGNIEETYDRDTKLFLKYTAFYIGMACSQEHGSSLKNITPQQCRLRDITYAAPISVDIEYSIGKTNFCKKNTYYIKNVHLGWIPIMLKSSQCSLNKRT